MLSDATDWTREPGRGKYARPERERRFLVATSFPALAGARLATTSEAELRELLIPR